MTELKKVHGGVADLSTTYKLFQRHEDKSWEQRTEDLYAGEWWETTEEAYWNFLEVMPPKVQEYGGFVMLEATTGNVHSAFYDIQINGERRYFHASIPLTSRQAVRDYRNAIQDAVMAELEASPHPGM